VLLTDHAHGQPGQLDGDGQEGDRQPGEAEGSVNP
jgi:hypothetical protein